MPDGPDHARAQAEIKQGNPGDRETSRAPPACTAARERAHGDQTFRLKVITAPASGHAIPAPPIIRASDHSNWYLCGNCGTLLVIAEAGQLHGLVAHCRMCGAYNAVET